MFCRMSPYLYSKLTWHNMHVCVASYTCRINMLSISPSKKERNKEKPHTETVLYWWIYVSNNTCLCTIVYKLKKNQEIFRSLLLNIAKLFSQDWVHLCNPGQTAHGKMYKTIIIKANILPRTKFTLLQL